MILNILNPNGQAFLNVSLRFFIWDYDDIQYYVSIEGANMKFEIVDFPTL